MRCYVVWDIMNTQIEFLTDPATQDKPVLRFIRELGEEGKTDNNKLQLYKLILRGLEFLKIYGLQESFKKYFTTHKEDGSPYTIMLVKTLRNHVPLIEFRVNWIGTGAYRAIFFEHRLDSETQILFFVRSIIKNETFDLDFERIVLESETIYAHFVQYPEQYISLLGDDKS